MSALTENVIDCTREMRWLAEHRNEYGGQWVALDGDKLLASGPDAREVYEAARRSGVELPLVVQVESQDELPFGGWQASVAYSFTFDVLHRYDPALPGIDVPVVLSSGNEAIKTTAKLDTGASLCIFKREHGEALGLDIESGMPQRIGTATEPFIAYGHNVSPSALGFHFDAMVFFAANAGFRRNVLGRRGWMERIRLAVVDYDGELYASKYE